MNDPTDARAAARRRRSTRLTVILVVAAAAWCGWLAARWSLEIGAYDSDGTRRFQVRPDVRTAVWQEPTVVDLTAGIAARRTTLSPDGRRLVFGAGERGLDADLFVAERTLDGWTTPRRLHEVNSDADDVAPAFGADGLYFASDRGPLGRGLDLWFARFDEYGFQAPELLSPGLQSDADDTDPAPLGDGRLVFASRRAGDDFDLFEADLARPGDGALALTQLNSPADDREPSGNATVLWFASDRAGDFDPFRSFQGPAGWLEPRTVDALSTPLSERAPWLAPDGFTLWFERGDDATRALHVARSRELYRVPPPPIGWRDWALAAALLVLALGAWLARRYHGLEFLTRCVLVSLIAHLGLLWWLRYVHPEDDPLVGVANETRYTVSLVAEPEAPNGARRSATPGVRGPERSEPTLPSAPNVAATLVAAPAPTAATREHRTPIERPARQAMDAARPLALPKVAADVAPSVSEREPSPRLLGHARPRAAVGAARVDSSTRIPDATLEPATLGPVAVPEHGRARPPVATDTPVEPRARPVAPRTIALPAPPLEVAAADRRDDAVALGPPRALGAARKSAESGPGRRRSSLPAARLPAPVAEAAPERRSVALPDVEAMREPPKVVRPASGSVGTARARVPRALDFGDFAPEGRASDEALPADEPDDAARSPLASAGLARERRPAALGPERHRFERAAPEIAASALEIEPLAARVEEAPEAVPVAPLYGNRFGAARSRALEAYGGSPETERSVRAGLAYLVSVQQPDGGWGRRHRDAKYGDVRIGKTGLALLAFLGAGHVPGRDGEHREPVERAIAYLLRELGGEGHIGDSNAYGHGIATYALAEAYALTSLASLEVPLTQALGHLVANQTLVRDARNHGGWGYYGRRGGSAQRGDGWSRVSVTAWQVMALVSATTSGFELPGGTLEYARTYLASSWDERLGAYRYAHDPERLRSLYATLPASTPAALFALSLLGEDIAGPRYEKARRYLLERLPERLVATDEHDFVLRGDGNLYYWAYATLALFRVGGDEWQRWNLALKELLLPAQAEDGSWPSESPYSRFADDHDHTYSTALAVLMLEVYYRYVTPTVRSGAILVR